jgi:hypothetical protein
MYTLSLRVVATSIHTHIRYVHSAGNVCIEETFYSNAERIKVETRYPPLRI